MKKLGAIFLIVGTCLGSGMIALPMVLAKLGLLPSLVLMIAIWYVMYYTSLINLELNLQANQGLALGELGKKFSGRIAEIIGISSLKLLSYALLAVFIYGGSSMVKELLESKLAVSSSLESIATYFAVISAAILLLPIKWIDYVNRVLTISLLVILVILVIGLAWSVKWTNLPLFADRYDDISAWVALIPVVFTSFGFQVIFHTLTNYCNKNAKMLKQAFFWGSLIPALVYLVWTFSILGVIHNENPHFYLQMVEGNAEVGELVKVLSVISHSQWVQILVWWISILSIVTSIVGVGVGLYDSLKEMMPKGPYRNVACSAITMAPPYLAVLYVPNAFISVLGFAGMILAVIAVILPTYLLWKISKGNYHYKELKADWLVHSSLYIAGGVIGCEIYNML